jgi:RNA polymerase sigma factor (sigma-70 family)
MDKVQQEVDTLYKEHFGKMVASLLYSFRDLDLETVEDVVQDTFSSALTDWQQKGIPANTTGWLYKVCRNKALNKLKKNNRLVNLDEKTDQRSAEITFNESVLDDPQLRLLFACANSDLSPKTQVVITLKYVVNLKVEAIAQVLGMTIDGVDKLLLRARQKIRGERILLQEPHTSALKQRLPIVHKIIYLTFNEGHKSSGSKDVLREDLCEEALLLNKTLIDSNLGDQDSLAPQALMLFNSARFKSRFSSSGELLDLENQNRALWNKDLILLAEDFLTRSHSEALSNYHLEAAIAYKHCSAASFKATEWKTIAGLYKHLLHSNPNPFVELNYAIALFYAGEKQSAFNLLNELQQHAFFSRYYLLNMTLGKFYHLEGDDGLAKQYLLKAFQQTNNLKERDFIGLMMEGLG